MIATARTTTLTNYAEARLTDNWLDTANTTAESTTNYFKWDSEGGKINLPTSAFNNDPIFWQFRRAPGFFDVVTYTGNGSSQTLSHNLEATPDLMLVKERSTTGGWEVYNSNGGNTKNLELNSDSSYSTNQFSWNNTSPTSTQFTVGSNNSSSSTTYIAFLFASLDGISKVGTFTGTGSGGLNVDCGFSAGPRFVLIKRATGGTGNWIVWDSARGLVSGNEPFIELSRTNAESGGSDYIDPTSTGFTLTSETVGAASMNASGSTYIFFAIA